MTPQGFLTSLLQTGAVFIVTLPQFPLNKRTNTSPLLYVSRVQDWLYEKSLNNVSCLMLSDTRLFVNYYSGFSPQHHRPRRAELEESFEKSLKDLQTLGNDCYRVS